MLDIGGEWYMPILKVESAPKIERTTNADSNLYFRTAARHTS